MFGITRKTGAWRSYSVLHLAYGDCDNAEDDNVEEEEEEEEVEVEEVAGEGEADNDDAG